MTFSPNPLQVLLLWKMIFMNYEPGFSEMKPNLDARRREELKTAGLIDYEKRPKKSKKKTTPVNHVVLTDAAWDWAVKNLDAKISDRSPVSGPVLHCVLLHLKNYIQQKNSSLYDFLHPQSENQEIIEKPHVVNMMEGSESADLKSRIRSAYFHFTNNQTHIRMRLAKLRDVLADVPRAVLDAVLRELKRAEKIFLFPLEDPQEKTPADDEAALLEAGRVNHVILFEE
ncbi:MAG: hypothetical protein AB1656_02415 [Candidatus Omnitrophota bacterium]